MTPTNKLRFLKRPMTIYVSNNYGTTEFVKVLQQWWEDKNITLAIHIEDKDGNSLPSPNRGEWRDVPMEEE